MSAAEDAYGNGKRIAFLAEAIRTLAPRAVLDMGCGTGEHLTRPLAERFPETRFVGVDSDAISIAYARGRPPRENLIFEGDDAIENHAGANVVIASEVLEHVEDPESFLATLRSLLAPGGRLIVTVPNGRGPFEVATFVESLMRVSGLLGALRRMKRSVAGQGPLDRLAARDTLAASPHVNFFSYRQVRSLFARTGLSIERYRARTFLCGFVLDQLVSGLGIVGWNARIADRLPPPLVSDWMFVLAPQPPVDAPRYRRGTFARWRKTLNERVFRAS